MICPWRIWKNEREKKQKNHWRLLWNENAEERSMVRKMVGNIWLVTFNFKLIITHVTTKPRGFAQSSCLSIRMYHTFPYLWLIGIIFYQMHIIVYSLRTETSSRDLKLISFLFTQVINAMGTRIIFSYFRTNHWLTLQWLCPPFKYSLWFLNVKMIYNPRRKMIKHLISTYYYI